MTDTLPKARLLLPPMLAMGLVILAANILVQYQIDVTVAGFDLAPWLTYGAISYPIAFLVTDTTNRLFGARRARRTACWKAPFVSSLFGSAVDTALFFSIAFAGTVVPWVTLGLGDFVVKLAMATLLLPAFRAVVALYPKSLWAPEAA